MDTPNIPQSPLFLRCHSPLVQQALLGAFSHPPLELLLNPRQLPVAPCGLLLVDQPLRHEVLLLGQWLRWQRPACRCVYLITHLTALRWVVAQRCGALAVLDLTDEPLKRLPMRVELAWKGSLSLSASIDHLLATQAELIQQLAGLSLGKLLVLVQWVEGARPRIIAQRLGLSLGSVYQTQARLRVDLGVRDQTALWQLLRPPVATFPVQEL